ncbi:MAG: hypothetical protein II467_03615 [Bacilli bacterium]|nr:hypothetical protein [Bacilli bacterium]
MKKRSLLLLFPLLASLAPLSSCGEDNGLISEAEVESKGYKRVDFSWQCNDNKEAKDSFYYSDSFFSYPASQLNISFARVGYAWALSNFAFGIEKGDYSKQTKAAESLATSIGFSDFESNEDFKHKPSTYSIGFTAAKKSMNLNDKAYTVLLLGVRGAGYEAEWASNFTIGQEGWHTGFLDASNKAITFLSQYIDNHQIKGNIKVLVSGYSRAGATTNLFAASLNNSETSFNPNVTYAKDDIYAFCFEPPKGGNLGEEEMNEEKHSNIHCFLNPNDLVPLVAPTEFGFARFGKQYYYPSTKTDPDYGKNEGKMLHFLNEMIANGHRNYGRYAISSFSPHSPDEKGAYFSEDKKKINYTVENEVQNLIHILGTIGIPGRDDFYNKVQKGLIDTIGLVYSEPTKDGQKPFDLVSKKLIEQLLNLKLSKALLDDLLIEALHPFFATDLTPFLMRAFHEALPHVELPIIQEMASGLSGLFVGLSEVAFFEPWLIFSLIDLTNLSAITQAHFPEINYFWLKAMDPLVYQNPIQWNFDKTWQKVSFGFVSYAEVKDSTGNVIMKIDNGYPVDYHNGYTYGVRTVNEKDIYEFYFPADGEFEIIVKENIEDMMFAVHSYYDNSLSQEVEIESETMELIGDSTYSYKVKRLSQ